MDSAEAKRLERHLRAFLARRHIPPHVEFDDLVQIGLEQAVKAERRFDPDRDIPVWLWCKIRAEGAVKDCLRYHWRRHMTWTIRCECGWTSQCVAPSARMAMEEPCPQCGRALIDAAQRPPAKSLELMVEEEEEEGVIAPFPLISPSAEEEYFRVHRRRELTQLAQELWGSEPHLYYLLAMLARGYRTSEIAPDMGVSEGRVSQLKNTLRARVKSHLSQEG